MFYDLVLHSMHDDRERKNCLKTTMNTTETKDNETRIRDKHLPQPSIAHRNILVNCQSLHIEHVVITAQMV